MSYGDAMKKRTAGMTLIELVIVVAIVGILAMIAYPAYTSTITKVRRNAAAACLSNYAQYMERFYTANMRYDKTAAGDDHDLPQLDCASTAATGEHYEYELRAVSRTTYTLGASPKENSAQERRDAACGTLTLNQAAARGVTGSADVSACW